MDTVADLANLCADTRQIVDADRLRSAAIVHRELTIGLLGKVDWRTTSELGKRIADAIIFGEEPTE